jgi:hypothetical protein
MKTWREKRETESGTRNTGNEKRKAKRVKDRTLASVGEKTPT